MGQNHNECSHIAKVIPHNDYHHDHSLDHTITDAGMIVQRMKAIIVIPEIQSQPCRKYIKYNHTISKCSRSETKWSYQNTGKWSK